MLGNDSVYTSIDSGETLGRSSSNAWCQAWQCPGADASSTDTLECALMCNSNSAHNTVLVE